MTRRRGTGHAEWAFIIGSLVSALVVIIGANAWALSDGTGREVGRRRAVDEELHHLLAAGTPEPRAGS